MKSILLDIAQDSPLGSSPIDVTLSFGKYIRFLKARIDEETTIRKGFFQLILDKLETSPAFGKPISVTEIGKYEEQLSLVCGTLIPPMTAEKNVLWALGMPLSPAVFYGTDALYAVILDPLTGQLKNNLVADYAFTMRQKVRLIYSFVLKKLYNFTPVRQNDIIISLVGEKSNIQKYYRINVDTRFTDVYAKTGLPEINPNAIRRQLQEDQDFNDLIRILPLSMFRFEGVSVITLTDVTREHTLENLKNVILNRNTFDRLTSYLQIVASLKAIVGDPSIEFVLMPLLKVNNKLIFNSNSILNSRLISAATQSKQAEKTYLALANEYFQNPKVIFMRAITEEDEKHEYVKILKRDGVKSYALLPVYSDNKVAGVMEVYSTTENTIDEAVVSRLNPALPLIATVFETKIEEFHSGIENVIREKFTSLQPAVQWKFRDVAWHYLRDKGLNPQSASIERIGFKDVYPLYGAIDIRNSTIERNDALRADHRLQFAVLIETLLVLKHKLGLGLVDEMVFKCRKMIAQIMTDEDSDEMKIRDFLEADVHPFLVYFKGNNVFESVREPAPTIDQGTASHEIVGAVDRYFQIIDEKTGEAFAQRRALEASILAINSAISVYVDSFKMEMQQSYPAYFEKFRTDGVEYDIYIGQSIEPERAFNTLYLKNIRLWQLSSMAAIAKITHSLLPSLEKKLLTTQLIFINSGTIDISFRDDERRFDVEGASNIRYQVIKKRIDKARIRHTGERLTQPGKIAMVYFNNKSAEEYVDYIRYLQENTTLLDDLEFLDLEELQGVSGLRALRVGVNLQA